MFCGCENAPESSEPNANVCPVCLAHPGALPVPNREAVRQVLRVGTAIGGTLAEYSEFDRKNYYYPDMPKGYQISQYEHPLVLGGSLAGIAITRVHLEEDTARSAHEGDTTLLDYNRAGVPLMELVTEPVIHTPEEAGVFAKELQLLLRTLGASHANLEKGEMRVEANISVGKNGNLGTKVEVKNLNSFRSVERAIAYEMKRHIAVLESGGSIDQETRGWDDAKQETFRQRVKEGAADYRYFPDPDIPKLLRSEIPELSDEALQSSLPELPWVRRTRYKDEYGVETEQAAWIIDAAPRAAFFDAVARVLDDASAVRLAANYLTSDVAGYYNEHGGVEFSTITPEAFASLIRLYAEGTLSSRGVKDVLARMLAEGGDPKAIAEAIGAILILDPAVTEALVREVLAENPAQVEEYRSGKESILQYLVGQGMKKSKGSVPPGALTESLKKALREG